jgi:hypothetical protein
MFLNITRELMADALIGGGVYAAFNNSNARLCTGDSATAEAVEQTDLQAATNKLRKGMDATYPTRSGNVLTFRATFSTSEANWTWNEWAIANAASGGQIMQRKVQSPGTKGSGSTWQATATVTVGV